MFVHVCEWCCVLAWGRYAFQADFCDMYMWVFVRGFGVLSSLWTSLGRQELTLGLWHPSTLASLNNLANLVVCLGMHADALAMMQRAVEGYSATLGEGHPSTKGARSNLAVLEKLVVAPPTCAGPVPGVVLGLCSASQHESPARFSRTPMAGGRQMVLQCEGGRRATSDDVPQT